MKNGIDCIGDYAAILQGKRLGLVTSVSGVGRDFTSSVDILHSAYHLTALYGPEHGVRGAADAGAAVESYTDPDTGLPVHSLYRKDSKHFTQEMLADIDALVYDIQDVGTRYYTYISTLLYALGDCAKYGKELIVLDRINPLGGSIIEGNVLREEYKSFVGAYPLCTRYGLTAGEFARMANAEQALCCNLSVVPCAGWKRSTLFSQNDLCWMMPSLGIPRFETALLYPGTCIFEGTNVSEGRGTSCPFELIGAPWVNARALTAAMSARALAGVAFTAAYFTPSASKHAGQPCEGVHIHITDAHAFRAVETAYTLLYTLRDLYPDAFAFLPPVRSGSRPFISFLAGSGVFEGEPPALAALLEGFAQDEKAFLRRKEAYHLYE